uniref:Uncharacterized protein n=1 Tax=Rhizophora mucronata TaxID=61149 RepID=A0A2P2IMY4_RHIMU
MIPKRLNVLAICKIFRVEKPNIARKKKVLVVK